MFIKFDKIRVVPGTERAPKGTKRAVVTYLLQLRTKYTLKVLKPHPKTYAI